MEAKTKTPPPSEQTAQCPACGGAGTVRDDGPYMSRWDRVECGACAGTGKRGGRIADMPRPEQSAARTPSS